MSFDTKTIDLAAGPVDLVARTDIAAAIAAGGASGARVFMQNIGEDDEVIRYAEQTAEPALDARGHILQPGDGLVLDLAPSAPGSAWVWAPGSAGEIAVSPSD